MLTETKFEITPRTVTFATKVVAVGQVVSAGVNRGRPFFAFGLLLIAGSLALLGYDLVLGKGLTALRSGGSTLIWAALIGLGIGVFSLVFQRRSLTIALADGAKIHLPAARADFLSSVVTRIGEVMAAEPYASLHFRIDMTAETIEILAGPQQAPIARMQPTFQPPLQSIPEEGLGHDHPASVRDRLPTTPPDRAWNGTAARIPPLNGGGLHHHQNGNAYQEAANPGTSHRAINGALPADASRTPMRPVGTQPFAPQGDSAMPSIHTGPDLAPMHGIPPRAPMTNGRVGPAVPPNPKRELDALVAFVLRSEIQHKSALLDLLSIVDDHLQGGSPTRADAVAHWQSFSGYVDQYLGDVEGLVPLTRRVGRNFTHA